MPSGISEQDEAASPPRYASGPQAPSISLPKAGGAIRGMGEKFSMNPATGTGTMRVPIVTPPGRSGLGPQLSLTYDSGSGNGVFGIGWTLATASIFRKTEKGLPLYQDSEESDVFLLSGAEDLVPVLDDELRIVVDTTSVPGFAIRRYRSRLEGLFSRIERWTDTAGTSHWRSISRDDVLTIYGADASARIADPADERRVFGWLISQTRDDKGNAVVYEYVPDDGKGIDTTRAHERHRGPAGDPRRATNRYLKRIRYGNRLPLLDAAGRRPQLLTAAQRDAASWMFEVVLDYDEDHVADLITDAEGRVHVRAADEPGKPWSARPDAFSSYRAGFEVRTTRLCRRALVFHHFPGAAGVGASCLVRSTDLSYEGDAGPARPGPAYTFLRAVTQYGYSRDDQRYLRRGLPKLEFDYTRPDPGAVVEVADPQSLENLPVGIREPGYQWVDLHGEGVAGILAERAGAWYYKRNLSPLDPRRLRFAPLETVATQPGAGPGSGRFMDLAGDGKLDLVVLDGPVPGLYEHDLAEGWEPFRPFTSRLERPLNDPDVRFVDLDGDGRADVLLAADDVLVWHRSLGEAGFGPAARAGQLLDEKHSPRLAFTDRTGSVFIADVTGDGLGDLLQLRNGEACYWPNLGHGRFGAKVTMDGAPWFDHPDQFDAGRLVLADIDGSGTTDVIYLHRDGVRLYFNQSGSSWSSAATLAVFPPADSFAAVRVCDLFGDGMACLVWSSSLPGNASSPLRYVRLMKDGKPHLLAGVRNNLGAETRLEYAPSTRFFLQDSQSGSPWLTRLPFPVQVVARVEARDLVSGVTSVSRYAYHHGHFDGEEREFRGFGFVEQWDTDEVPGLGGSPGAGPRDLPDEQPDGIAQVPPALVRTWFHTGAVPGDERVSRHFSDLPPGLGHHGYYREPGWTGADAEAHGLPDTVLPAGLTPDERREACRALKGTMLRQEVYGLDGSPAAEHPYAVTEQNSAVVLHQARGPNRHAVFLAHTRETVVQQYERDPHDPRVSHALTLEVDAFGNVRRALAVAYGRRPGHSLLLGDDRGRQEQPRVTYTESDFTVPDRSDPGQWDGRYRVPSPCETRTYEVTGLEPGDGLPLLAFDHLVADGFAALTGLPEAPYEQPVAPGTPGRRLVGRSRTLYRRDDLDGLLPPGVHAPLGLPGETYRLAFTPGLVTDVYRRDGAALLSSPANVLAGAGEDQGGYLDLEGDGHWWAPSGRVFYSPGAADDATAELDVARRRFFLPHRHRDAFGATSVIAYDTDAADPQRDNTLFPVWTEDAVGNVVAAEIDYRVLQPGQVTDPNGNRTRLAFDALGAVAGTAVMGKAAPADAEGDSLDDFVADLTPAQITAFRAAADPDAAAIAHLGTATARYIQDLDRVPVCTAQIVREVHESELAAGQVSPVQLSFGYSDGFGREIQLKLRAEPGPVPERDAAGRIVLDAGGMPQLAPGGVSPRWVGSGWVVYTGKGRPLRRFEPFFSDTHDLDTDLRIGVSPWLLHDAVGRIVVIVHPDHTYDKVVFGSWSRSVYDAADTVVGADGSTDPLRDPEAGAMLARIPAGDVTPSWYARRIALAAGHPDRVAAERSLVHRQTPTVAHLDALSRPFLTVTGNRFVRDGSEIEESYPSRLELDITGNQLAVRDAVNQGGDVEGRLVQRNTYDLLGRRIHESTMDTGGRWSVCDAAGNVIRSWDARGIDRRITYDPLRRPSSVLVTRDGAERLAQRTVHGEAVGAGGNHRTRVHQSFDGAGVLTNVRFDFKGNILASRRDLLPEYRTAIDWAAAPAPDDGSFTTSTTYDALNRPRTQTTPDGSVHRFGYNEANLLRTVDVGLRPQQGDVTPWTPFVADAEYDARGLRTRIDYANGASTVSVYDPRTLQLTRLRTTRPPAPDATASLLFVDPAVVQDLAYSYDAVGNVTRIADGAAQPVNFGNQHVAAESEFTYDAAYRLVEATGREHIGQTAHVSASGGRDRDVAGLADLAAHPNDLLKLRNYLERFEYDAVGNLRMLRHVAGNGSWTRDYDYREVSLLEPARTGNRLSSTTIGNAVTSTDTYGYTDAAGLDGSGCIMSVNSSAMVWDDDDRLHEVDLGGGGTAYYVYDATGLRVRKVVRNQDGSRREERLYVGGFEIYRRFGADPITRETVHIMDDVRRIAVVDTLVSPAPAAPVVRYHLGDHLGSAALELDPAGALISAEEFHPYGTTSFQAGRSAAEVSLKRYRYAAKERDDETGFAYHGARYYAPWLGRWTSPDPRAAETGPNPYAYCRGRPTMTVDSDGALDDEAKDVLRRLQQTIDEIPQKEFTNLSRAEQGTRAHLSLESIISVDPKSPAKVATGIRLAPEVIVDTTGKIVAFGEPGQLGKAGKDFRSIDVALLKSPVADVKDLIGKNASDVIEAAIDYKTGAAKLKGVGNMEGLIKAPYVKAVQNGDVLAAVEAKTAKMLKNAATVGEQAAEVATDAVKAEAKGLTAAVKTETAALKVAEGAGEFAKLAKITGKHVLMAIPLADLVVQQIFYEELGYGFGRPMDTFLNLTIAEIWEIPIAVYSASELLAKGLVLGSGAAMDAGQQGLEWVGEKSGVNDLERSTTFEIYKLYGIPH